MSNLIAIVAIVAAAQTAQPPSNVWDKFEKRELWESAERYRAKWKDAEIRVNEANLMLQVRTATTVRALAMSYERPPESSGLSTGAVVGLIGGAISVGVVLGILLAPRLERDPAVVVVGSSP